MNQDSNAKNDKKVLNADPTKNPCISEENVGMGVLGAIIGSIIGGASILLFSTLGYVASLSGLIMACCTLGLYEKFAKSISKKGIIICIVIMLVMVVLSVNVSICLQAANEAKKVGSDIGFSFFFKNFYSLLDSGDGYGEYIGTLVMVYLFSAIGAFSMIKNKLHLVK